MNSELEQIQYDVSVAYGSERTVETVRAQTAFALREFAHLGVAPTHMAAPTGKLVRFVEAKLDGYAERGLNSRYFSVGFITAGDGDGALDIEAVVSFRGAGPDGTSKLLVDETLADGDHRRRTLDLAEVSKARYGIGFTMARIWGPMLYVGGGHLSTRRPDPRHDLVRLNISFWSSGRRAQVWERGLIRDVYPLNWLNEKQLARPVDGLALADWIETRAENGKLTRCGDMGLWEVEASEIPRLRSVLVEADIIFNWPRHIEGAAEHPNAAESERMLREGTLLWP